MAKYLILRNRCGSFCVASITLMLLSFFGVGCHENRELNKVESENLDSDIGDLTPDEFRKMIVDMIVDYKTENGLGPLFTPFMNNYLKSPDYLNKIKSTPVVDENSEYVIGGWRLTKSSGEIKGYFSDGRSTSYTIHGNIQNPNLKSRKIKLISADVDRGFNMKE